MEFDWDWDDEGVGTVVYAPAFGGDLEATVEVADDAMEAFAAAVDAVEYTPSKTYADVMDRLQRDGQVSVDVETIKQIGAESKPLGAPPPEPSTLVEPAQAAALRSFVQHQSEWHKELVRQLRRVVEAADAEREAWYARRAEQDEQQQRRQARKNLPYGWGDDADPWEDDDDDDYAAGLFDDPAEEDPREAEPRKPFRDCFSIDRVHVSLPGVDGRCELIFAGNCDWDEEHGLGVRVFEGEVMEVGSLDLVR